MKKPKLSLGKGGMKGFLVQNVEKIVFGVAVFMVIVFVYMGFRIKSYDTSKTPDKLKSLAARAVSHINEPTADEILKERKPRAGKGGQYETRVQQQSAVTDPGAYSITVPWDPPAGAPGSKREDPTLYPPLKIETFALTAPLCVRPEPDATSPLADLDDAPLRGKNKPKRKRKKRRRNTGAAGSGSYGDMGEGMGEDMGSGGDAGLMGSGGGSEEGLMGSGGSIPGMTGGSMQGQSTTRFYPADKVCGYRPGGVRSGMPGMSGGEGYDEGMMGSGGDAGLMGSGGGDEGLMGSGGGMMGSGGGMMGSGGGMMGSGGGMMGSGGGTAGMMGGIIGQGPAVAESRHIVIVKALAPYRKESDEFEHVLGNAVGYQPMRDRPRIVFFQAQRADVTADPSKTPDESQWKSVTNPKHARQMMMDERWHGTMAEVADPRYVDPNITMPIPPIMLRCLEDELIHSDIPKAKQTLLARQQPGTEAGKKDDSKTGKKEPGSDLPGGDLPGGMVGGMGAPGMPGMGMPGSGSGMPGMGMPGMSGGGYDEGMMGSGGYDEGMMGSGGYGGYGGYMGSAVPTEAVQYKLVRFFDMSVEPHHIYRYRVRLFYEDPNNPNTDPKNGLVTSPPARRTLAEKVLQRLNKQKEDPKQKDAYYVITEWSTPSDLVELPSNARLFAGHVAPERFATGVGGVLVPQSEPKGTVAAVGWDETLAVDVAAERPAYRGSVFNYTSEFDVLDPVTLAIKLLKDFHLQNNIQVLDLQGGEDLPGDRQKKVVSEGEYLLLDEEGNLVVRNELDDTKPFRFYTFADEPVHATTSTSGYGDMGEGGDMGMPGMSGPGLGMPGVSGPGAAGNTGRGRRRR